MNLLDLLIDLLFNINVNLCSPHTRSDNVHTIEHVSHTVRVFNTHKCLNFVIQILKLKFWNGNFQMEIFKNQKSFAKPLNRTHRWSPFKGGELHRRRESGPVVKSISSHFSLFLYTYIWDTFDGQNVDKVWCKKTYLFLCWRKSVSPLFLNCLAPRMLKSILLWIYIQNESDTGAVEVL